jgi:hypothetical protein
VPHMGDNLKGEEGEEQEDQEGGPS